VEVLLGDALGGADAGINSLNCGCRCSPEENQEKPVLGGPTLFDAPSRLG
jgi:hypothetical protein